MSDEELALAWRATATKWWLLAAQLEKTKEFGTTECQLCHYTKRYRPPNAVTCEVCPARDLCHDVDAPYRRWFNAMNEALSIALQIARDCDEEAEELEKNRR